MRTLITVGILVFVAQTALAQSERRECPGLKAGAPDDKQAQCWFEREQSAKNECASNHAEVSECIQQTALWCTSALLDDETVANSCFLANVRAGQLDNAVALKRYIRAPTTEVAQCRQALEAISVKFLSVPEGAELLVEGRSLGKTPVEIELPTHWWRGSVLAKFGEGEGITEVAISQQDLMKAFDRHSCTMAEVNIEGPPEPAQPLLTQTPSSPVSKALPDKTRADERGGVSVPGIITMAVGGAGTVAGGVLLALAFTRRADILSASNEKWTPEHQNRADSVKPLSIGGFAALGAGVALVTVGIILLLNHGSSTEKAADARVTPTLRLTGQGVQLSGSF
jgi:hypothetical protein